MEATWQIGAFVRPWGKFSFDEALAGVAAAGYSVVGLLGGVADLSLALDGMDTAAVGSRLAAHGLMANLACLHVDHSGSEGDAFASLARQVERAKALGVRYLMTFGADHEPQFARWYAATRFAAACAEPHGIQVVFKPHGGCTAAANEIERCFDEIAHPNVRLWYDAGNIIHYTEKDPIAEARRVAARTSGFCAKDCATQRGEVMLEFGEGVVDFVGVFEVLAAEDFTGPVMVECCRTGTWEETTASARRNREFLEALRT
ncbi:MAG: sugar phosphate isomerase/epimerase [Armatimonadetes bacterium]|nr:sugar phosphate isomerase/epimerase [Armatimonadota bacterium]